MQDVRFTNVDDFLAYLPDDERRITERLRGIILDCLPTIREKLRYNVPFYSMQANICFIWPGAVPWGKVRSPGVRLGFTRGNLLDDPAGYLEAGTRKHVCVRDHYRLADLDEARMIELLYQAAELDEQVARAKGKGPRKESGRQT